MSTRLVVIQLNPSQTGLTLSAQFLNSDGTTNGTTITTGFVEVGGGFYSWLSSSYPTGFRGVVKFSSSGTILAALAINPEELENVDAKVSSVAPAVWATDLGGYSSSVLTAAGYILGVQVPSLFVDFVAANVTSTTFDLFTSDPNRGDNLANWYVVIQSAGANGGQYAKITASNTSTNTQTIASWPGGTPTGTVKYFLVDPATAASGGGSDPWTTALPGSYSSGQAGYILGGHIGAVASVTAPVTAGTVSDKTGYALASTGLDSISVTAPSSLSAPNFRQMVVMTYRRWFKKAVASGSTLTIYADDGTTPITTQAIPAVSPDQTQGAAS